MEGWGAAGKLSFQRLSKTRGRKMDLKALLAMSHQHHTIGNNGMAAKRENFQHLTHTLRLITITFYEWMTYSFLKEKIVTTEQKKNPPKQ